MLLHLRSWSRRQADGHELPGVGWVVLDDGPVRHAVRLQEASKGLEALRVGLENNGVRAGTQAAWGRFSGRMADLGREDTSRQIGPDNHIVGNGVCRGGLTVNRSSWTYGSP